MEPMITLLIGHRGTGKSSFLARLAECGLRTLDLDEKIESLYGPISRIWQEQGESAFRKIETEVLASITRPNEPLVIAVGAGFEGKLPADARVIWVRRETDADGRSFLDRPRLDANLSPHAEYMARFTERETRYRALSHETLTLPEGGAEDLEGYVKGGLHLPYDLTLLPENFRDLERFTWRRLGWGVRRFELRDDLLSSEELKRAAELLPSTRVLRSIRREPVAPKDDRVAYDWPLEFGMPPDGASVLSMHERGESIAESLDFLTLNGVRTPVLKAAIETNSFEELMVGHRWWLEEPARRAFLPRSSDGRWAWYRSLFGPKMPIHFFREGAGSAVDQPWLWQVALQTPLKSKFAAVLGHPIHHSRSPLEHRAFFAAREMPMVAIPLRLEEFDGALPALLELGLTHAAITSPLKPAIDGHNTLKVSDSELRFANTDAPALAQIASAHPASNVWLWGAGGVKDSVLSAWPRARVFSAREGQTAQELAPDLLIWATGRARNFKWPRAVPREILDLNYTDDSPGLELAVRENLPYRSGLEMFKLQARLQQQFWSEE